MKYMTDTLGIPSNTVLGQGCRKNIFFNEDGTVRTEVKQLKSTMDMFSKPLKERIENPDFLSFIEAFLKWNPKERISSVEALAHPWISKGLPEELKNKLSTGGSR